MRARQVFGHCTDQFAWIVITGRLSFAPVSARAGEPGDSSSCGWTRSRSFNPEPATLITDRNERVTRFLAPG